MYQVSLLSMIYLFFFVSCSKSEDKKISVVTGIAPVASLIKSIGGDLLSIQALIPPDVDPHTFALKPSDAVKIERSDLVIALHQHLDSQIVPKNQSGSNKIFYLSHETNDHRNHDHDDNIHLWLSFEDSKKLAHEVNGILSMKFPQYSNIFAENTQKFIDSLSTLQRELREAYQNRKISVIQQHAAWDSFFKELNVEVVGNVQKFEKQRVSLHKMVSLIKDARAVSDLILIVDAFDGLSPVMNVLAHETKAPIVFLNPLETKDGNTDIIGILRENGYKILNLVE